MAAGQSQHAVAALTKALQNNGKNVRFCIHPVAGRLPGHMDVLLAEAKVPYKYVFEMEKINPDFPNADLVLVVGANDTVNSDAVENPTSSIYGMPVCEVWRAKKVIVIKRNPKNKGYNAIENPLFYKPNCTLFCGNPTEKINEICAEFSVILF